MRELTRQEVEAVSGGAVPLVAFGAAIGVGSFVSGASIWATGGNWAQVTAASVLGGVTAATGGLAGATVGAARLAAFGVTATTGLAANLVPQTETIKNIGDPDSRRRGGS